MSYFTKDELDDFFDTMFTNFGTTAKKIPSVDIYEDNSAFVIEAELPGYEEGDVDVNVDKHVLHITSKKNMTHKDRKYLVHERNYVSFDRAFTLPETVNEDAIEASFKNGVLVITLPKMPVEQPKRISVKIN